MLNFVKDMKHHFWYGEPSESRWGETPMKTPSGFNESQTKEGTGNQKSIWKSFDGMNQDFDGFKTIHIYTHIYIHIHHLHRYSKSL